MPSSSSPANYHLVEPHPSVPKSSRAAIHTARGGAGNVINLQHTKTTPSHSATGPPSATRLDSRPRPPAYKSGRGGAGNTHSSGERAIFSFDEELERELRRAAPVYHVGRGGKGNMVRSGCSSAGSGSSPGYGYASGSGSGSGSGSCAAGAADSYSLTRKLSGGSSATNSSAGSAGDRARDRALRGLERSWGKIRGVA